MIRSISAIGALWPLCKCGHIAQEHDNTTSCSASVRGQCPTCNQQGVTVKCNCTGYTGPTWEKFKKDYLTQEELDKYNWNNHENNETCKG